MQLSEATIDEIIDPEIYPMRIGLIPTAQIDDEEGRTRELWLLGTLISERFSDFGGSCEQESPLDCLLREVDEESNGLLTDEISLRLHEESSLPKKKRKSKVWKWTNRNNAEKFEYLIFLPIDYDRYADIWEEFEGNEENTAINWYYREDLERELRVSDWNTSIQKFMRQLGFKSK